MSVISLSRPSSHGVQAHSALRFQGITAVETNAVKGLTPESHRAIAQELAEAYNVRVHLSLETVHKTEVEFNHQPNPTGSRPVVEFPYQYPELLRATYVVRNMPGEYPSETRGHDEGTADLALQQKLAKQGVTKYHDESYRDMATNYATFRFLPSR